MTSLIAKISNVLLLLKVNNIYTTLYKCNKKQNSKDLFLKIKELKRGNQTLNKYHDFFKRGLVFVLDTKANNITLIAFNMFADNSLPKKVKNF